MSERSVCLTINAVLCAVNILGALVSDGWLRVAHATVALFACVAIALIAVKCGPHMEAPDDDAQVKLLVPPREDAEMAGKGAIERLCDKLDQKFAAHIEGLLRDQLRKEPEGDSFPVTSGAEQQQDEVEAVSLAVQAYVRTMMRERDQRIAELEETLELCLYELQDGRGYADEACDRVEDIVNAALRREAE